MTPRALLLVLGGISSVQFGAAFARTVFDDAGPEGTVMLRTLFAALILAAVWRPALRGYSPEERRVTVLFGLTLAAMNLLFYESIDRIPLGVAVTFEFVGPLGVAIAGSHRALDLAWVALAAGGILLIARPWTGADLDLLGVLCAFGAGACWAAYILLSVRSGRALPGGVGLTLAMVIAAVLLLPVGVAGAGGALLDWEVIGVGAAAALLSSVIPYSAEFEALRTMPQHIFGVLLSLEPGAAALVGFLVLGQDLAASEVAGIAAVVAASAGAASRGLTSTALEPA